MSLIGKLKGKLEAKMAGAITASLLKRAAEGKFGPLVQKLYWALDGSKTLIGVVFAFLAGVAQVAADSGLCAYLGIGSECDEVARAIAKASAMVSAGFLYLGQVGGGLKTEAPARRG